MNEKIKEILDKLNENKDYDDYVDYKGSYFKPLLDYITNLQEENKELLERFSNKIEEVSDLIKENEKLKLVRDTKCASEILCECLNNVYKSRIDKAINKIQYIIDYGFDYDGFNNVKDLKGLIDMLVDYARQSKDILQGSDKGE